jgi:hypothetical protein
MPNKTKDSPADLTHVMSDAELIANATRLHLAYCKRKGQVPTQPDASSNVVDKGTFRQIFLRNESGILVRYNYRAPHQVRGSCKFHCFTRCPNPGDPHQGREPAP